ncbi:MAG: permease-like cell division protein FtsX [Fusobacteriaceae bacterium]
MFKKTNKNFLLMIYMFFILNIAIVLCLNFNEARKKNFSNNFVQIELKNNLSTDVTSALEKKLIGIEGAKKVRYVSKEESIREIVTELGLDINEVGNPLYNTFMVNVSSLQEAKKIENSLIDNTDVSSIYYDTKFFEVQEGRTRLFFMLGAFIILFFIFPMIIILLKLYVNMIRMNYIHFYFYSRKIKSLWKRSVRKARIPTILSGVFGTLIFSLTYTFVRQIFMDSSNIYYFISTSKAISIAMIASGIVVFMCLVLPLKQEEVGGA